MIRWLYTMVHRDPDKPEPPHPEPVPRPGLEAAAAADPATVYDRLGDVPAISPQELGAWLSA